MTNLIYPNRKMAFAPGEIILISVARNEMVRLPSFLTHYRTLGVDKFLIVDNGSTDGTSAYLSAQADVFHVLAPGSYGQANCGHDWIIEMLGHCGGHWCVVADCDEFFVYPGHQGRDLRRFVQDLQSRNETAVCSYLLDMYSSQPFIDTILQAGQDPLEVCRYFDTGYHIDMPAAEALCGVFPMSRKGGMRRRLFGVEPCLNKISFFQNLPGTSLHQGAHYVDGAMLSSVRCATLHFKYLREFHAYALAEAHRGEHFNNASEYKAYDQGLRSATPSTAYHDGSQELICFERFFSRDMARLPLPPIAATQQNRAHHPEQSILMNAIGGSAGISLYAAEDHQVTRMLLANMAQTTRTVAIAASVATAALWRELAVALDYEVQLIDFTPSPDQAYALARASRAGPPLVLIEAVDRWRGRHHFVDMLVGELRPHVGDSATYFVDISDAVIDHTFHHAQSGVACYFGRMPRMCGDTDLTHFVSRSSGDAPLGAACSPRRGAHINTAIASDVFDAMVLRNAIYANAMRSTLVAWGAELVETFKIVNSMTAFKTASPVDELKLAKLGIEMRNAGKDVLIAHHRFSSAGELLSYLAQLGLALGLDQPSLASAERVLMNEQHLWKPTHNKLFEAGSASARPSRAA